MATSMNTNSDQQDSTVGVLLVFGDIISNDRREDVFRYLERALKQINGQQFQKVNGLFNDLINGNEFQADAQYRQLAKTDHGSMAGFLYLPGFHTVCNVLQDYFNACAHVCLIFCGQQLKSNGALVLADSLLTSEHFSGLFNNNVSYRMRDLHVILPFVSDQWSKVLRSQLEKYLPRVQINDASIEVKSENRFGAIFYERLHRCLNDEAVNFDINAKLTPKDTSGTIAFDEPNLYVLYGQQGEASLFGVRGFVVLVNGGYSRIPSYWNLIRGLQSIDACILTHFDYDVLPGLQTLVHRKTIPSPFDGRLCKPDIGAIFLNPIQRGKLQSSSLSSSKSANSRLLMNLTDNVDQFLKDVKKLNIDTFDLVQHSTANKAAIQPINLFRKIAFGSLDLYVLHPTTPGPDEEKNLASIQKIPIHNHQSSAVPSHHWYSSCSLLVWTPNSKSHKEKTVRILYTGACPQTVVFDALTRVRHLEFLHSSNAQSSAVRQNSIPTSTSVHNGIDAKHQSPKPKASPSLLNGRASTKAQQSPSKPLAAPKAKVSPVKTIKSDNTRTITIAKKASAAASARSVSKEKKKPASGSTGKQGKSPTPKPKSKIEETVKPTPPSIEEKKVETKEDAEPIRDVHKEQERSIPPVDEHEPELLTQDEDQPLATVSDHVPEEQPEMPHDEVEARENYDQEPRDDEETNHDAFAEDINENNGTSMDKTEDEAEQSEPELLEKNEDEDEPFAEVDLQPPINGIESPPESTEPVVDKADDQPNDPSTEPTDPSNGHPNEKGDDDDEMEVIHHDISVTDKHPTPSKEEIQPLGLPIENKNLSKTTTLKKVNTGSTRPSRPLTPSTSKSKSNPSTSAIFHVDVAYIPFHGDEHYVDSEFFRRIRAQYYILNAVEINRRTLNALMDGKQQWERNEQITLVPTFDGEQLRQFFIMNKNRLAELNINILPASSRCHVQYDEEACPAQRLRFGSNINSDEH